IITAKRKGPDLVDFRAATGWRQITPGNSAFDGPAFVAVLPMIEGTIHYDSGVDVKLALIFESRNGAGAARRQKHVELCIGCVDLEFVVAGFVGGGFKEQLEDVIIPSLAVVLLDIREDVGVLHLREG